MVRGHAMYGSPYRNYNSRGGGFGRGHPKRFQPPPPPPPQPPPPRKGDVFEEAGRLAAEYLVSKGLLPPNALSGKWQNGNNSFKNRDFQFLRAQQEGDNNLQDSRTLAFARLGGDAADGAGYGSGRRRSVEDFNPNASRDYLTGRRRMGSVKGYGSDGNREFGRSGSLSDKARVSLDIEGSDNAAFAGYMEQQAYSDAGSEEQKLLPNSELSLKHDALGNSESDPGKNQLQEEVSLNENSSTVTGNDITAEANLVPTENDEGMEIASAGTAELEEGTSKGELDKVSDPEDITIKHCEEEDNPANVGGSDLLALSRFAKVPTRTRSSLTIRVSKTDPVLPAEDENSNADELSRESAGPMEEVCTDVSLPDISLNQNGSLKNVELSEAAVEERGTQLGLVYKAGQGLCTRFKTFPQRSFASEVESSEGEFGFSRSSSLVIERGEKRILQHSDGGEGAKRPREWNPSDSHLSNSMESQQICHEGKPSGEEAILAADQQKGMHIPMYSNRGTEPCNEHAEEKQLFPGSFKICDLNLMEASDLHENHEVDPVLIFPSIPLIEKEADPVDIDLSMSSNGNTTNKNGTRGVDGKDVEVIDLEIDSAQDKAFNNSEQKDDALFAGFESFPEQAQSANEIPDGQDGYGLMISELLGADIPNCSPVQPDINSLHNDMGIHNGEGILGDDDSIYMSLGEIPISFLRVWDPQPTQEYEKPF